MELSQPRPYGAQGAKPTHDFLSLYSAAQQDPTPRIPGGYLKPEGTQSSSSNNNDENLNCSSYTLWEESKVSKKTTGLMPWMKSVKFDSKIVDQKSNSPRSKHSATEQRRRSKINDRFSMLREIIPHADQKRDKASFLLEVIEYVQFLQEKVHKYEDSYQGWTNNPPDLKNNRSTDQLQLPNNTSDTLKDEQLIIESGMISISNIYSQGISSALTLALKRSGVDMSEANISVQIDLGKRLNMDKQDNNEFVEEGSGEGLKRFKRSIN